MTVETVAWQFNHENAGLMLSDHQAGQLWEPLVLRSDYEATHARAERLAIQVKQADERGDEALRRAHVSEAELEGHNAQMVRAIARINTLEARAQRAEQALRELVAARDSWDAPERVEPAESRKRWDRLMAAWAAARAIVESRD